MPASLAAAVFLSYASQDSEAARRLAEALRAAGVEVWFDLNELQCGDAWDAKIRGQIAACTLFVPLISAATQARREGYFRLEWKLAAQRTHMMSERTAFLLPVVIDGTHDSDADVPPEFKAVQWTRLPEGASPAAFAERVRRLLDTRQTHAARAPTATVPGSASPPTPAPRLSSLRLRILGGGALALAACGILLFFALRRPPTPPSPAANTPTPTPAPAPAAPAASAWSEARRLAERARELIDGIDSNREDYRLAEDLVAQANAKDSLDPDVYAIESLVHHKFLQRYWDTSDTRLAAATTAAQRALRLDPHNFDARYTQVMLMGDNPNALADKERALRELRGERPGDRRVLRALARVLSNGDGLDEALALFDEAAALPGGDPLALYDKSQTFWFVGRAADAEQAIQAALKQRPFGGAFLMATWYRIVLHGDSDGAREFLQRLGPAERLEDRAAYFAFYLEFLARRPMAALQPLLAIPRDWIKDAWFTGPKGLLVGQAYALAGRPDAAALEWNAALRLVEQRLAEAPNDRGLLINQFHLLARLDRREEAGRLFAVLLQATGQDPASNRAMSKPMVGGLVLLGRHTEAIRQISLGLKLENRAVIYTAAMLRFDPMWDPLRAAPAFASVVAEAEEIEAAAAAEAVEKPASAAPVSAATIVR